MERDVELIGKVAGLEATMVAARDEIRRQFADLSAAGQVRHEQNTARLERIEHEVRATNGRVTRHDEQIRTLFRTHRGGKSAEADAASTVVTFGMVEWVIKFGGWIVAGVFAALKLAGKL